MWILNEMTRSNQDLVLTARSAGRRRKTGFGKFPEAEYFRYISNRTGSE